MPVLIVLATACGTASTEGWRKDCSGGVRCAAGQTCLEYYGIAGRPLYTCEILCQYDWDCPEHMACSCPCPDGPGQKVCNPAPPP